MSIFDSISQSFSSFAPFVFFRTGLSGGSKESERRPPPPTEAAAPPAVLLLLPLPLRSSVDTYKLLAAPGAVPKQIIFLVSALKLRSGVTLTDVFSGRPSR